MDVSGSFIIIIFEKSNKLVLINPWRLSRTAAIANISTNTVCRSAGLNQSH
jgi:hypothetical protein